MWWLFPHTPVTDVEDVCQWQTLNVSQGQNYYSKTILSVTDTLSQFGVPDPDTTSTHSVTNI